MRQIVLDTETTGLNVAEGHRIIEIAGVELINRRLTGRHYHQYLCPERSIETAALAIHGITETFLEDKPKFQAIAETLLAFLQDAELIIHNAPFDIGFLDNEFKRIGTQFKPITDYCRVLDTLALARKKHPGQQNSLDALCKRYKVDNSARDLHGALLDTHLLAQVYLVMTGGQTTLFGGEGDIESDSGTRHHLITVTNSSRKTALDLKVLKADEQVLREHAARLQAIREANGGVCLWEEG